MAWMPVSRNVLTVFLMLLAGCATKVQYIVNQGLNPENPSGVVTNTFLNFPSAEFQRAYIYEIDGELVPHTRRSFRLPAGEHTIRVWPIDSAPRSLQMVPDTVRIRRENISVESITINVQPGHRYFLAARTNVVYTRSTIPGADSFRFPGASSSSRSCRIPSSRSFSRRLRRGWRCSSCPWSSHPWWSRPFLTPASGHRAHIEGDTDPLAV